VAALQVDSLSFDVNLNISQFQFEEYMPFGHHICSMKFCIHVNESWPWMLEAAGNADLITQLDRLYPAGPSLAPSPRL
jgi:hypothetical protein